MNYGLRNQLDEQKLPRISPPTKQSMACVSPQIPNIFHVATSEFHPPGPITARRKHLAILSIRIFFPPLFSVRSIASLVFPTAVPDLTAFSQPLQLQVDCDLVKLLVWRVHVFVCFDATNGVDRHHSAPLTTVMGD